MCGYGNENASVLIFGSLLSDSYSIRNKSCDFLLSFFIQYLLYVVWLWLAVYTIERYSKESTESQYLWSVILFCKWNTQFYNNNQIKSSNKWRHYKWMGPKKKLKLMQASGECVWVHINGKYRMKNALLCNKKEYFCLKIYRCHINIEHSRAIWKWCYCWSSIYRLWFSFFFLLGVNSRFLS